MEIPVTEEIYNYLFNNIGDIEFLILNDEGNRILISNTVPHQLSPLRVDKIFSEGFQPYLITQTNSITQIRATFLVDIQQLLTEGKSFKYVISYEDKKIRYLEFTEENRKYIIKINLPLQRLISLKDI